jgi:hypothetical protein
VEHLAPAIKLLERCSRLVLVIVLTFICQQPCGALFNPDLIDSYLEREFDWGMFVDVRELRHYLNYPESQLSPLTNVQVHFRWFPRDDNFAKRKSRVYEEFWYHHGSVIGSRRYNQLHIPAEKIGVVIVGRTKDSANDRDEITALANALLRVMIDLQLKQIVTSAVMVPMDNYDDVAGCLERYHFTRDPQLMQGRQMSIHLRSYPQGRDEYYFFKK